MNNKELIAKLSERTNCTKQEASDILSALTEVMTSRLVDCDSISLPALGLFEVKKRGERISVNPVSGKRYLVPPKLVPVFKPGNTVKNKLKDSDADE